MTDRPASSAGRPVVVVSRYLPDPRGWAAARLLDAFVRGAHRLGRDLTVWSWWPYDPPAELPSWVRWDRLPREAWWRMKVRALARPRSDVGTLRWRVPEGSIALADDPLTFAAVRRHPASVLTLHYLTALDRRALGSWRPKDLQDLRIERSFVRHATVTTAYSQRVAKRTGHGALAVPAAIAVPADPLPARDAPVAACVGDWAWPPNRVALDRLLAAWPRVRAVVPAARLLLAGRGSDHIGAIAGVTALGPVADSRDVLAEAAVVVFPSPDTSGPKVKVMEAVSLGVPVVTTPAGVEGLALPDGAVTVVPQPAAAPVLADAVAGVLRDPAAAAARATTARVALAAGHAPEVAAARRLAVIDAALAAR